MKFYSCRKLSANRDASASNLWAPDRQLPIVDLLAAKYKLSSRLHAIIGTSPPTSESNTHSPIKQSRFRKKRLKNDIEIATDVDHGSQPQNPTHGISHYKLAEQMINYQSIDVGAHCELFRVHFSDPAANGTVRSLRRC